MQQATRYSKKREAILQAIMATKTHPSAEWIYQSLKPTHPELSLATVYRNLLFFQEQGMVQSVGIVNGQEHFDGTVTPHCHFICDQCHAIIDLDQPAIDTALDDAVEQEYGFTVHTHELTFHGVCQHCMQPNLTEEEIKV